MANLVIAEVPALRVKVGKKQLFNLQFPSFKPFRLTFSVNHQIVNLS